MGHVGPSGQAHTTQLGTSGSKPLAHKYSHHRQVSPVEEGEKGCEQQGPPLPALSR